jgi:hypothetical protein
MFRTTLVVLTCCIIVIVSGWWWYDKHLQEGIVCQPGQKAKRKNDYREKCESGVGRCTRTGEEVCIRDNEYRPITDPTLKASIANVQSSCANALYLAKAFNDNIDDPVQGRTNQTKKIRSAVSKLNSKLNRQILQSVAITDISNTLATCDQLVQTYKSWDTQLGQLQKQSCASEPSIDTQGVQEIKESAASNAVGIKDMLSSLESRLKIIETNLSNNEISVKNSKYYQLIIDTSDPQTFDFSLPNATPLVSIVGIQPQKLQFVLPKGTDGELGETGPKGEDFTGKPPTGIRGPQGEPSYFKGLPEQWTTTPSWTPYT